MGASVGPRRPHADVESRWRARWEADGISRVDLATVDPGTVFVNLAEFPYPSAEGLHIGHVFRYAGVDAFGRYQRMRGRAVFQPMGFDSFGIHTENYALRTGEHPATLTARTIVDFREQLSRIGVAWDWSRSITTSDPEYYRWTQWILCRLFDAGLMYQADAEVVWCPSCLTVLAREQTETTAQGVSTCERCATAVVERPMRQWFLRITDYAERLRDGLDALDWPERAKRLQRQWIGGLHDWLISRQRYWGPPIPIIHCPQCGPVAVPDDQLPVVLPDVDDVRPTGTGVSPLAALEDWVVTTCPNCNGSARRETDVSDTFVDSAWYFLRYPSTEFDDRAFDAVRTARVLPVDFYAGGVEHVQRHHLYARFVTMALHDMGLVPFDEPFPCIRLGGMIIKDGAKMSKSRGNVIGPDGYIDRHGADVLRCALLFSAPWDHDGDFRERSITGIERFFNRAWRSVVSPPDDNAPDVIPTAVDAAVVAVTESIERLACNVAIARLMAVAADPSALRSESAKRAFVRLLAPFAPHLAEEMWAEIGEAYSVHQQPWPEPSGQESGAGHDRVDVPVQVDGKRRGVITIAADADQLTAVAAVSDAGIAIPPDPARVVYVSGRVLNFVSRVATT